MMRPRVSAYTQRSGKRVTVIRTRSHFIRRTLQWWSQPLFFFCRNLGITTVFFAVLATPSLSYASEAYLGTDSPTQQFAASYQLPDITPTALPGNGIAILASLAPITESTILVRQHTVQKGETVRSIADFYGLSEWTVRQANGLSTYSTVRADQKIDILPTDGLLYSARKNIQLDALAAQNEISLESIRHYNPQLDGLDTLSVGKTAFLPGVSARSAVRAARSVTRTRAITQTAGNGSASLGETTAGFAYGYCTAWAATRVKELGGQAVTWRGNGGAWASNAAAQGRVVNKTPEVGAIVVTREGSVGHVAVIEQVNEDGSFVISEQNYSGWNTVSSRTLTPDYGSITGIIHP